MVEILQSNGLAPLLNPSLSEELATRDATDATKAAAAGKILGKFTDHAALETGYSALEAESSRMAQELAALKKGTPVVPVVETDPVKIEAARVAAAAAALPAAGEVEARAAVENAGLDFDSLRTSYDTNGTLSEAELAGLEKSGIPRALVADFIAGQEARVSVLQGAAYTAAGGETAYTAMTDWALTGIPAAEIAAYNTEVNSGDKARITAAVTNLAARHKVSEGQEPNLLQGKSPSSDGSVFTTMYEVQQVMRTPQYKNDSAFRATVVAKMARSNI
jgi:hypothetical protein